MSGEHGFLMTTMPSKDKAADIARLLIAEKLAACVQILPVESFYSWNGETQNEPETFTPEIVGTPFTAGLAGYFAWIDAATG